MAKDRSSPESKALSSSAPPPSNSPDACPGGDQPSSSPQPGSPTLTPPSASESAKPKDKKKAKPLNKVLRAAHRMEIIASEFSAEEAMQAIEHVRSITIRRYNAERQNEIDALTTNGLKELGQHRFGPGLGAT